MKIDVIILCGGFGKRLQKVVYSLPKILAPIQGVPFIEIFLKKMLNPSLTHKIILSTGHLSECIETYVNNKTFFSPILVHCEKSPLGTGGAIMHCLSKIETNTFLVINGDTLVDYSLDNFLTFHQEKNSDVTILLQKPQESHRYGKISINANNKILSFSEKTVSNQNWINAGVYLFQKEFLQKKCFPLSFSLEEKGFPLFLSNRFFGYPSKGFFIDIGTPSSYTQAQKNRNIKSV